MKVKKNIKMLPFIAWNDGRKEEGTSVSLSTYASLSYLHESSSNPKLTYTLQLHNKEKKNLNYKWKLG